MDFVWKNSLWHGIPGEHVDHWYRPLMGMHILFDQWMFGDAIQPRQWMNLIWFGGCILLLNKWFQSILDFTKFQSIWISTLLIVHPYSLELTQFIAARNDTMTLTFALGIPLLMQRTPSAFNQSMVTLLMFCALCSKESGLIWAVLLTLPIYQRIPNNWIPLSIGVAMWMGMKSFASIDSIDLSLQWSAIFQTWTHTGTWWLHISTPLQPIPNTVSFIGLIIIGFMALLTRHRANISGLLIFISGGLLGSLAAEQSYTLGFRYLWVPMMGQVLWLVGTIPHKWVKFLIVPLCYTGLMTLQERQHWTDNQQFWEHGYSEHPNQHTACGSFMTLRMDPELALDRLKASISPPPKLHCCAQAARYPLELGDMNKTIVMGTMALNNGCPNIPELLAPMAMAFAVVGNWEQSIATMNDYNMDPFGYKPLLETAYGLKVNNEEPLIKWTTPENPLLPNTTFTERQRMLRSQAEGLLQQIQTYNPSK